MTHAITGFKGLVLAVHPTARGFGWVLFESPLSPVDWGSAYAKAGRNARLIAKFERILKRYEPSALVLGEFEGRGGRSERIQMMCRQMVHLASCRDMETPVLRKAVVRTVFASVGAMTTYEIAQFIAKQIDAFSHRLPRKRECYDGEQSGQSLFHAAALAITYFAISGDVP